MFKRHGPLPALWFAVTAGVMAIGLYWHSNLAAAQFATHNSFALTPSIWSSKFETTINQFQGRVIHSSIELDYEFSIPENFDSINLFSFAAQTGRWSFLADSLYLNHSHSVNSELLALQYDTSDLLIEGSISYQIPRWEHIELIAGGRFFSIDTARPFSLRNREQNSENWADAFVGARIKYDFSDRWYATLQADVGTLRARVIDKYSVAAFVGYKLNEITTLELGYRQLSSEASDPENSVFQESLGVGLGVRF